MPTIKQNFYLNDDEMLKVQNAIQKISNNVPLTINKCLEEVISPKMTRSVTDYLPRSKDGKRHAKDNKWYEIEFYNMAFVLSNSLKGKRGTSFYYLYYPATGTGNSYKKGPNDFLEKGEKKIHNEAVTDLLNSLNKKIEEELLNE